MVIIVVAGISPAFHNVIRNSTFIQLILTIKLPIMTAGNIFSDFMGKLALIVHVNHMLIMLDIPCEFT